MFAIVVALHSTIQKLLGWKVEDGKDPASEYGDRKQQDDVTDYSNNAPDNRRWHDEVTEEFQAVNATVSTQTPVEVYGLEEFPFLSDRKTIGFLKQSHVMFIMRGLPGSGKSTIVRRLQQTYPRTVVCSADHFFTDSQGNYNFDASKLSEAHGQCQQRASDSCLRDEQVIIIDNTNIQLWTMAHYFNLAQYKYYYHCIIVEPNTPWRYDAEELARRNTHRVEKEHIASKVKLIRDKKLLPAYYGWFLSRNDSTRVVHVWYDVLKNCFDALPDGIIVDGEKCMAPREFLFLLDTLYHPPQKMLHCTARFLGSNTKDQYHKDILVRQAMGRKYSLNIIGFAFTERNVSALVDLRSDSSVNSDDKVLLNLFVKPEEEMYREKHKDNVSRRDSDRFFQHACSAHMTITFRRGGQAKHSGDDILEMCEKEYFGKFCSMKQEFGILMAYSGNMYKVILNEPFRMDCLFQGVYSSRGHR